jgi:hypothetical protein
VTREYVYVLKLDCSPPVYKIGMSKCPESRCRQYVGCLPWPVTVAHRIRTRAAYQLEECLHDRFKHCRLLHEWFDLSDAELAMLTALADCPTVADLPAHLRTADALRVHRRQGPPPRYDPAKILEPGRLKRCVTADRAVMAELGRRGCFFRKSSGRTLPRIGAPGGEIQVDTDARGRPVRDRISASWVSSAERARCGITRGQLWLWATGLGITLRTFLGDELAHLVPAEWLDGLPWQQSPPRPARRRRAGE